MQSLTTLLQRGAQSGYPIPRGVRGIERCFGWSVFQLCAVAYAGSFFLIVALVATNVLLALWVLRQVAALELELAFTKTNSSATNADVAEQLVQAWIDSQQLD